MSNEQAIENETAATEGLTFGEAIEAMKAGKRVARAGWNGKGMFIYYVPAAAYPAQRGAAKRWLGEGAMVPYQAYIAMKTADDTVVPWLASQTDMLAEDWQVIEADPGATTQRSEEDTRYAALQLAIGYDRSLEETMHRAAFYLKFLKGETTHG